MATMMMSQSPDTWSTAITLSRSLSLSTTSAARPTSTSISMYALAVNGHLPRFTSGQLASSWGLPQLYKVSEPVWQSLSGLMQSDGVAWTVALVCFLGQLPGDGRDVAPKHCHILPAHDL